MQRVLISFTDKTVETLDKMVKEGEAATRTELVRKAVTSFIEKKEATA